ncbi:MAG: cytochrome c [Ghiorsea sp.]
MTRKFYLIVSATLLLSPSFVSTTLFAEETQGAVTIAIPKASVENGKAIFNRLCAHCHTTTYDSSAIGAPGLREVLERHDETWLNHWLRSPEGFAKTDEDAKDLIESNPFGLAMPTLPAMHDDSKRADVIAYLKTLK